MICPICQSRNISIKDSRPTRLGRRRRYLCGNCGGRFTTMELPVWPPQEKTASRAGAEGQKGGAQ